MNTAAVDNDEKISKTSKSGWRHPWVIGLVGLIGVTVIIQVGYIIVAFMTFPGLVNKDYYDNGQNYSRHIRDRESARKALGWTAQVELPDTVVLGATQTYRYIITDKAGKPVHGEKVVMYAYRSSDASADFNVPMIEAAPGRYEATATFKLKGHWDVIFSVANASKNFNFNTPRHIFVMKI